MPKTKQQRKSTTKKLFTFTKLYSKRKWEIAALKREIEKLRPLLQDAQPDCFMKTRYTSETMSLWQLPTRKEYYHHSHRSERFIDRDGILRWRANTGWPWAPLTLEFELNWIHPQDLKLWRKDLKALRHRLQLQ